MGYREERWPKIAIGSIAVAVVLYVLASGPGPFVWHPLKERYFVSVVASCSAAHGLDRIPWQDVPAFDARIETFTAQTEQETAVRDCILRRAGAIMDDEVSGNVSLPTIESMWTDNHLDVSAPPRRVYYTYVRPAD